MHLTKKKEKRKIRFLRLKVGKTNLLLHKGRLKQLSVKNMDWLIETKLSKRGSYKTLYPIMMQRITAHYKFEGYKFQEHQPILLLSTIDEDH